MEFYEINTKNNIQVTEEAMGSKKYFWFLIACFFTCHWSWLGLTNHNRNSGVIVLADQQVCHDHELVLRELSFMFLPIILVSPLELL